MMLCVRLATISLLLLFSTPISANEKPSAITLSVQDIPIRHVLQLLANERHYNLIIDASVDGNISLNLVDVPWQQAFDVILKTKQLGQKREGNVLFIAPETVIKQMQDSQLNSEALHLSIFQINYADASDIAELIRNESNRFILSQRGSLTVDKRTNSVLIRDIKSNLETIKQLIKRIDVAVKQVQIEARIIIIDEGNLDEMGVRWGFSKQQGDNSIGGSIESNLASSGLFDADSSNIDDFLSVNLAVANPNAASIAFQVAKLGSGTLLDLELSALQAESKAEIISSPKLITLNNKPAFIEQGTEIPYLEAASSGATSVSFKKAVLSLSVTPKITSENTLILDLNVTQDRPGEVVKTGRGEAVAINTQRIGTQVLVNHGETVVLGGIYQHSVTTTEDKVPLLGDIPMLGALFRRSYEKEGKRELLIFITPKVIEATSPN